MTVQITLHGEHGAEHGPALVSIEDAERVIAYKWWAQINHAGVYAWTWGKDEHGKLARPRRKVFMHRFILDFPAHLDVDHRNRNSLDNRRENLRAVPKDVNGGRSHRHDDEYEAHLEMEAARAEVVA